MSLEGVEDQGIEGEARIDLEHRPLDRAGQLDESHVHLRDPQLGRLEVGRELLVGLQLGAVPSGVDACPLGFVLGQEEGEGRLVVLAERIGVVS